MDNLTFFRSLVLAALPVAARYFEGGGGAHVMEIAQRALLIARATYAAEQEVRIADIRPGAWGPPPRPRVELEE